MHERTYAEINVNTLVHNMQILRGLVPPSTQIMAVVKADGYGHGALDSARAALTGGAAWLGVATADEGIELRENGIEAPILVFSILFPEELPRALAHKLTLTVSSEAHAAAIAAEAKSQGLTAEVHLKLDTGMHRIGFPYNDTDSILRAAAHENLRTTGVYSHFAEADDFASAYTDEQFAHYNEAVDKLRQAGLPIPLRHMANSGALLRQAYALDMVRTGIAFYGISPYDEDKFADFRAQGFRPALAMKSRVSFVKNLAAGEGIGYSRTHTVTRGTIVATISVGYADGYGRLLSNRGQVLIHGHLAPILGNVCMDQMMADVTDIPGVHAGDEVVLIGTQGAQEITTEHIAALQQTIPYEIVTRIGKRAARKVL